MFRMIRSRKLHPFATAVRVKPSVDLSFTALLYFGATLFIGVAAMNSQTNLLFGVFGLMLGVILISGYISRFSLKKVSVRRIVPEHLVVADRSQLSYELTNHKRFWPSVSVSLAELDGCDGFSRQPCAYLLHAAPSRSAMASVEVEPKRRGLYLLDQYQISTSFPFGFIKRAIIHQQKETLVVFPALARVNAAILKLCQSAEKAGSRVRPRKGGDDEFYGVKEYRQGENPRHIHWRRSARTGELVIREMTQVAPPRLLLAVDNSTADQSIDPADVERAIAMGASLASLALERGHAVGLMAWSEDDWVSLRPQRGKQHRREMLAALARLGGNTHQDVHTLSEQAMTFTDSTTTVVIFSPSVEGIERIAGRCVALSSRAEAVQRYFTFAPGVDFAHSMPLELEPVASDTPDPSVKQPAEFAHV